MLAISSAVGAGELVGGPRYIWFVDVGVGSPWHAVLTPHDWRNSGSTSPVKVTAGVVPSKLE